MGNTRYICGKKFAVKSFNSFINGKISLTEISTTNHNYTAFLMHTESVTTISHVSISLSECNSLFDEDFSDISWKSTDLETIINLSSCFSLN